MSAFYIGFGREDYYDDLAEKIKSAAISKFWNDEKSDYFLTEKGQIEFVIKLFE